ncbi:MAG: hypothetical protein ACC656_10420, partial [Candidatus Heimdallarchaeota archaeon]
QLRTSYTEEVFWEEVLSEFEKIKNTKVTLEMNLTVSENEIEFGVDYNNNTYLITFNGPAPWGFNVTTYPNHEFSNNVKPMQLINNPKIIAAFLAVVLP